LKKNGGRERWKESNVIWKFLNASLGWMLFLFIQKKNDLSKLESFSTSKLIVTLIYGEFYYGIVLYDL
jgi:hypothetical protein